MVRVLFKARRSVSVRAKRDNIDPLPKKDFDDFIGPIKFHSLAG